MNRVLLSGLALALLTLPALAQAPAGTPPAGGAPGGGRAGGRGPMPPPPMGVAGVAAPVPITPDKEISFDQALDAAHTAMDACLALPRKSAAVVEVVDLNGNVRVQLAPDGIGLPFFDYARRKAYTVLKKGMSSDDFAKLPDVVATPRGTPFEGDPQLINFPGATPIMKNGTMIGVLSVSGPTGGDQDAICTKAGMAKFHLG
jgi:uncharacterized protein GlcG (DUF336 family)